MHAIPAQKRNILGFTLIELLMTIALTGVLIIPLLVTYNTSRANQLLRLSAEKLAEDLNGARIFARGAKDEFSWGVRNVDERKYEFFSRSASGDTEVSKSYTLEKGNRFAGNFSVVFSVGTGLPEGAGTITIESTRGKKIEVEVSGNGFVKVGDLQ